MVSAAITPAGVWRERLALLLSVTFSPFLCVPVFTRFIVAASARSPQEYYLLCALCIFLSIGVPLIYIGWNVYRGHIDDLHVSSREQRQGPFRSGQLSIGCLALCLWLGGAPHLLTRYVVSLLIQTLIFDAISRSWKISIHTGVLSACLSGCVEIAQWSPLSHLLVIPVGWSRIVRNCHTFAQVTAGAALGYAVTTLSMRYWT